MGVSSNTRRRVSMCGIVTAGASKASGHYSPLRESYQRLRAAGKSGLVASTAVMRKLLVILNSIQAGTEPGRAMKTTWKTIDMKDIYVGGFGGGSFSCNQ